MVIRNPGKTEYEEIYVSLEFLSIKHVLLDYAFVNAYNFLLHTSSIMV